MRDPRDVVASHRKRNFKRTIEEICKAWNNYLHSFGGFQKAHSQVSVLIKYEDLVTQPRRTLEKIFAILPITFEESMLHFYESDASVHRSGHPYAENLKRDFFSSSIGRWRQELSEDELLQIESNCSESMQQYEYHRVCQHSDEASN